MAEPQHRPGGRGHGSRGADGGVGSQAAELKEPMLNGMGRSSATSKATLPLPRSTSSVRDAGKLVWDWQAPAKDDALIAEGRRPHADQSLPPPTDPLEAGPHPRRLASGCCTMSGADRGGAAVDKVKVDNMLFDIEAKIVRSQILSGQRASTAATRAPCGRSKSARAFLPRVHGLAPAHARRDAGAGRRHARQPTAIRSASTRLAGEYSEHFSAPLQHAALCHRETGRMGSPKRREIGHGRLAEARWSRCCPIAANSHTRCAVASEITESNGSSSMASVCGATWR